MADGFFESRWDSLIWGRNGSDAADQSNGIVAFLVSSAESFDPGPVGRREDLLVPGLRLEEDATDRVRFLPVFTDFDWKAFKSGAFSHHAQSEYLNSTI